MISTLIIVFREVLEAALVIGIAMAASKEIHGSFRWIYSGIAGGMMVAAVVAGFAQVMADSMSGMGQEYFNALILLSAAILMVWTAIWMRKHGRETSARIRQTCEDVSGGVAAGAMLSVVVALSVAREGSELVLFLHGIVVAGGSGVEGVATGALAGFLIGAAVAVGLFKSLVNISMRHVFSVVTMLIVLLAAGMASQGVAYLVMVDALPSLGQSIWNTSAIIPEQGLLGQLLQALIGYDDRPSGIQVLVFVMVLSISWMAIVMQGRGVPGSAGVVAALLLCMGLTMTPGEAEAKKIYGPIVEEGELEFEYLLDYSFDRDPAKDGSARHQFEFEYGVTDRWMTSLIGDYRKRPGQGFAYQGLKWENIYQLFEQGERWLDAGLYFEYIFPSSSLNKPDVLEFKMLLEKEAGWLIHTANLVLKKGLGQHATKNTTAGANWRSRWRYAKNLEPAIEYYGLFGELGNSSPIAQQSHQVGLVFLGKIGDMGYEIGYLFGLTSGSDKGMLKFVVGYEF